MTNASPNAPRTLSDLGQSLWLDDLSRDLVERGTLRRYVEELSVTGLTSNPTILEAAISRSPAYDAQLGRLARAGRSGEPLVFDLALADVVGAADVLAPVHDRTAGFDGLVSIEVSPLLARDGAATVAQAKDLHRRAARRNVLVKIPGTKEGLPAIEEAIFSGIPVNVTLLFSREHYLAAADAYQRGLERRVEAGLSPDVRSVASVFVSRWDVAVAPKAPPSLRNRLGIAIARQAYRAYRGVLESDRWQRLASRGARPQRLLFASTGTKDPAAPDDVYVRALAARNTVDTMPVRTLLAFAEHGRVDGVVPRSGGDAEAVAAAFTRAGFDLRALANTLQEEGARAFVASWTSLLEGVNEKVDRLRAAPARAPVRATEEVPS
jgi:transaldolase